MRNRMITALLVSLAVVVLPIPVGQWLLPPESGMGFFVLMFLFVYPTLFVSLGGYLARYWKKLWWVLPVVGGMVVVTGKVLLDTWDLYCYLPIYFLLGYGVMAVSSLFSRPATTHRQRDIMDLHDL